MVVDLEEDAGKEHNVPDNFVASGEYKYLHLRRGENIMTFLIFYTAYPSIFHLFFIFIFYSRLNLNICHSEVPGAVMLQFESSQSKQKPDEWRTT